MSDLNNNWTIYVHINKVNGKKYVGITGNSVEERWEGGYGYCGQIFYEAIKKYGWDNFDHIILKTGLEKENAENEEKRYIKELKSHISDWGYNVSWGGEGSSSPGTPIYSFNLDGRFEKAFKTIDEAAYEYGLNSSNIVSCCQGNYSHAGEHIFKYQVDVSNVNDFYKEIDPNMFDCYWPVYQFDFDKNLVAEYRNAMEASSQQENWVSSSILDACRGNYKYAYGFLWEFKRNITDLKKYKEIVVDLKRHPYKGEPIIQFGIDGKYIKEYPCAKDASEKYGCSRTLISYACSGRIPTAVGYQWRYKKDYSWGNIGPYYLSDSLRERHVAQYKSIDGELVNTYRNPSEASRETGIAGKQIIDVCNGKQKTAHGFIWKFYNNEPLQQVESYPNGSKRLVPVIQLSLNREYINRYPSIRIASKETGIDEHNIASCCSKKSVDKTAGGYIWVKEKDYQEDKLC